MIDGEKYAKAMEFMRMKHAEPPNDTAENRKVYLGLQMLSVEHMFEFMEVTGYEYVNKEWRSIDESQG